MTDRKQDIVERLLVVESSRSDSDGTGLRDVTTNWYRNPDGPEAAAEIERLRDELTDALNERDAWMAAHEGKDL